MFGEIKTESYWAARRMLVILAACPFTRPTWQRNFVGTFRARIERLEKRANSKGTDRFTKY